ncbi:MAG: hypothetical protein ACC726_02245 [Chloroflexota bacterium]
MPIASSSDPLRGVSAGHVDLPSAQRSGLSATVGLVTVVGLLLVAGTLAVSGGGILNSGGRFGGNPAASASAPLESGAVSSSEPALPLPSAGNGGGSSVKITNSFDFTCAPDPGEIRDANKARWQISRFVVADREDVDRVTWEMSRTRGSARKGTRVRMEWMDIKEARQQFNLTRLPGQRAIVITFDGPAKNIADQIADARSLELDGAQAVRTVQMFVGEDGKVRTVIGVRGDGCAKMTAPLWKKKGKTERAKIFLSIEKP